METFNDGLDMGNVRDGSKVRLDAIHREGEH